MKYRTKLYLALWGTSLVSIFSALAFVYYETKQEFIDEYSSKVLSIASTAAASVDADLLKTIRSKEDVYSENYRILRDTLRKDRDANRREDVYVKYLYTLKISPDNPKQILYVVDTEEKAKDIGLPNDVYTEAEIYKLPEHIKKYYMPKKFIHDETGVWLMATAPILDKAGNFVGAVEVDIAAGNVLEELNKLLVFGIWALIGSSIIATAIAYFLAREVTRSLHTLCACILEIGEGNLKARADLHTNDEFNDMALAINEMATGLQERERLKMSFARYVSRHIMEKILESETPLKLEGERRKITVLFSDIRQFTKLSEKLSPEQVVSILNRYFETMIEVIFKNHGTLDKFLGDGLMVEFGAPLEDAIQEKHAVMTAIEMQKEIKRLCSEWEKEGKPKINIGIGIHTGFAVVGNIGSEKRTEYTAIGDTVNVASRLEFATKILNTPILFSEETYKALDPKEFKCKNLGPLTLPGRAEPVTVYTIENDEAT